MGLLEALGRGVGGVVAPVAALGSLTRGARLFHPDGVVYRADVRALQAEGALGDLARRLEGPAIIRLSGALFRHRPGRTLPDVLGAAVRFGAAQDLLFATFRRSYELPVAMLATNAGDFLANEYYTVLPSDIPGREGVTFRLVPFHPSPPGRDRRERLARAVADGAASFELEARRAYAGPWTSFASITLRERADVDQEELRFNPFHDGLGIVPHGFLQAVRAAVYPASQIGRALAHGLRAPRERA
jgi:hypothetical protein